MEERGKVTRFLNSTEDVNKLAGVAEDIRDAMMDYQVRLRAFVLNPPNMSARRCYNKTSTPIPACKL